MNSSTVSSVLPKGSAPQTTFQFPANFTGGAGAPTLNLGTSGSTSAYMAPTAKATPATFPNPFDPVSGSNVAKTTVTHQYNPPTPQGPAITTVEQAQQAGAYDAQHGSGSYYQSLLSGNPVNYSVSTGDTYDSSMMSQGSNSQSLQDTYNKKVEDIKTNPDLNPSDKLMQDIFNAKQYTPEEAASLQHLSDVNSAITAATLSERRNIKQLQENGQLTKEQAAGFISESQRQADAHLADLSVAQTGITNSLGVQAAIRNNQLGAYQTLFDMTKGSQTLSPGQSLYSPTGKQVAGAQGIAPQVTTLAQQLYQQSLTTGNTIVNPQTGQPDFGAYLQQAAQLTGLPLPQGMGSSMGGQMSGTTSQGGGVPGGTYGSQGYGDISKIPAGFQKYVVQTPLSDSQSSPLAFVQEDKVPTALKDTMKSYAANAGIPYLDSQGTSAFYAAQQILNVVDAAKALSIRNLAKGTGGRISNTLKEWANNYLQFNPDLSNFAQLKDAASKATTALAGGQGSGFRMNMGIIEAATANLPTAHDSQETALTKADALATQIINGLKPVFPGITSGNYGALLNSSGGSSSAPKKGNSLYDF